MGKPIREFESHLLRHFTSHLAVITCGLPPDLASGSLRSNMSIATKTGDDGTTGLLFNRRVPKDHPRVEAYGACDELNAAIGVAKSLLKTSVPNENWIKIHLHDIQKTLVVLMGELAVLPGDRERYVKAGHRWIVSEEVEQLTQLVNEIESQHMKFDGWATPGAVPTSAALDMARVTCRRAERRVYTLGEEVRKLHPFILRYLNRLSDLLWLMARKIETENK